MHSTFGLQDSVHQLNIGRWALVAIGIALIVLGLIAFSASVATTLISVVLLGVILVVAGIIGAVTAFRASSVGWVVLRLLFALLTVLAGVLLITRPVTGALTLTLFMGWYFIFAGLAKAVGALVERPPHTGWEILSSVITFLLGLLLLIHWPITGLIAIGLFIAIDMVFFGASLLLDGFNIPTAIDTPHQPQVS